MCTQKAGPTVHEFCSVFGLGLCTTVVLWGERDLQAAAKSGICMFKLVSFLGHAFGEGCFCYHVFRVQNLILLFLVCCFRLFV